MPDYPLKRIFGKPETSWKLKTHSLSKLWIGLADGRTLTFFSRDWPHDKSGLRDQTIGIKRFEKLLAQADKYPYTTAIIYDTHTGEEIAKYREGKKLVL